MGRRRYSREQWAGWISEQAVSGMGVAAFCEARELSVQSFYLWRRKLSAKRDQKIEKIKRTGMIQEGSRGIKRTGMILKADYIVAVRMGRTKRVQGGVPFLGLGPHGEGWRGQAK